MISGNIVAPIAVVIPTLGRGAVLLDTIQQFLAEHPRPAEIVVVDQTAVHPAEVELRLSRLEQQREIRWIRLSKSSQPSALNRGILETTQPFILFVDDDIRLEPGIIAAHLRRMADDDVWAVAGRVIQPGDTGSPTVVPANTRWTFTDIEFPFKSDVAVSVENAMSGNLSVRRDRALALGGFDENFLPPVSYRFDLEFCKRLVRAGGRICFEPAATIHHLRYPSGGTRAIGSHLTSSSPLHGVGDYYFVFRQGWSLAAFRYVLRRPFREVATRFHLRRPWWIPVKLLGEARAIVLAHLLSRRGARLINHRSGDATVKITSRNKG